MARILYVAKLAVDKDTGLPIPALAGQTVTIVKRGTTTPAAITEDAAGALVIPGATRTVSAELFVPSFWVDTSEGPVSALGGGVEVPLESVEGVAKRLDTLEPQFTAAAASAAASAASAATSAAAVPAGGATGQVLVKASNADRDTAWVNPTAGGGATDHNTLANLTVGDPHTQYHTDARGDARYYLRSQVDSLVNNAASANSAADRNRANHSGTQPIASIQGLQPILDGLGGTAVNSVAGKTGAVTLVASDISDTGATGREVMGATTTAAARTAIGAAATTHTHTATAISDSTSTGRALMTAASDVAARSAIGAGTSNLAIGTTGTTAMRGNAIVVNPSSISGLPDGTLIARTA